MGFESMTLPSTHTCERRKCNLSHSSLAPALNFTIKHLNASSYLFIYFFKYLNISGYSNKKHLIEITNIKEKYSPGPPTVYVPTKKCINLLMCINAYETKATTNQKLETA